MKFLEFCRVCKAHPARYVPFDSELDLQFDEETSTMKLGVTPWAAARLEDVDTFFDLMEFYMTVKVFAHGPKVFCPTAEQLRLLGEMTLNVPIGEYVQPFETFVIELPPEFVDTHIIPCDTVPTQRPLFSILHYKDGSILHALYMDAMSSLKAWFHPCDPESEVEDWFSAYDCAPGVDPEEHKLEETVRRCALAYALLLDEVGVRKRGPAQPGQYAALRKTADKNNQHSTKAREQLRVQPMLYELKQDVKLYTTVETAAQLGEPTGRTVTPHHRRGHYRHVACGPGRSERRRTRIPPCFVNKHLFLGSMADAKVRYS